MIAAALALAAAVVTQPSVLEDYATKVRLGDDMELALFTPTMFRLRTSDLTGDKFPPRYEIPFAIGRLEPWPAVAFERVAENIVRTDVLEIRIDPESRTWSVWTHSGEQLYPSDGPIYGMFRDGTTVFDAASAFGERNNNSRYSHWFYDPATGRYVDTYLAEDVILDEFFIYGPGYDALFAQLNALVGPEPLLPKKAFGFFQTQHLGCDGDQTKLLELARELRARDIPTDTLIIDFEWGDGCPGEEEENWGRLDWAPSYQAPLSVQEMLAELERMHFDVMLIHHSAPDFPHRAAHTPQRVREWTAKVYDESLWWERIEGKLASGVDGTWQDTRQNDISDSVIWNGIGERLGSDRRVLFMGCRKMMEQNPWELGRDNTIPANNLIGSRRYPFRWTGDISTTYRELAWHIDAITNRHGAMKGVSYITADAFGKDWRHQARWNQFVDFLPVSRSHTMKPWDGKLASEDLERIMNFREDDGVEAPREARVAVSGSAEESIRKHRKLRYRLLPYLYSAAHETYRTGLPITRPMLLAFPEDLRVQQNQWPYQYMLGDALLVAPVHGDFRSMEIYLPEGFEWIDYWDGRAYAGGLVVDYDTSDVAKLPLFVRAGSILPMRADNAFIDPTVPDDPLTLDVFPSGVSSTAVLYEDDGVSTHYRDGQLAATRFEAERDASSVSVVIGGTEGDYLGKPDRRRYVVNLRSPNAPNGVTRDGTPVPDWTFDPERQVVIVSLEKRSYDRTTLRFSY